MAQNPLLHQIDRVLAGIISALDRPLKADIAHSGVCVAQNEDVQKEIRSALMTESAKISEIAAKHGFSFTSEEGQQAWDAAQDNELSDFELDMVAGGVSRGGGGS